MIFSNHGERIEELVYMTKSVKFLLLTIFTSCFKVTGIRGLKDRTLKMRSFEQ